MGSRGTTPTGMTAWESLRVKSRGGTPHNHAWRKRPGALKLTVDQLNTQFSNQSPKEFVPIQMTNNIVKMPKFPITPEEVTLQPSMTKDDGMNMARPYVSRPKHSASSPRLDVGTDHASLRPPNPFPEHVIVQVDDSNSGNDQNSRAEGQETKRTAVRRGLKQECEMSLSHDGSSIHVMDQCLNSNSKNPRIVRVAT